ncbi:MAG: hypothetical protein O3A00_12005 [Planctomycetota bacterium]|nr:hypothetical protein [Planctomycetota bacterium]
MRQKPHSGRSNGKADAAVPPGAPSWVTAELIADTLRVWQRYYDRRLTPDDAVGSKNSAEL